MAHIVTNFNKALRRQARAEAPPATASKEPDVDDNAARSELQESPAALRRSADNAADSAEPARKRLKSPTTSVNEGDGQTRETTSRVDESTSDFPARPSAKAKGRLWTEGEPPLPRNTTASQAAQKHHLPRSAARRQQAARSREQPQPQEEEEEDPSVSVMIKQPETRPISQEQLVAEVKGIYAGLVMVESKCIEVDSAQSAQTDGAAKLNNEQWQALIALHRTLLHEHHDFFLASQHPSASPALRKLASKYAMPARMWRHGIHSFLELLRHRLPASLEHMLTFIYLAYSMMALLYETVPAFEDTWIECLGDLGRYRMAIEDEDIRDREIWTGVSRHWYSKASDKAPTTGRLHHHLAILARPNAVQQLFFYTKSLCVAVPFKSARDSILTLFDPILSGTQNRLQPIDLAFVKAHGILFIVSNTDEKEKALPKSLDDLMLEYGKTRAEFLGLLDHHIARTTRGWLEPGAFIAIANSNALLEYGKTERNTQGPGNVILSTIIPQSESDAKMEEAGEENGPIPSHIFGVASELVKDCDSLVFRRYGDNNVLPYLNVRLSFMNFMARREPAMRYLESSFPWTLLANMLTSLTIGFKHFEHIESQEFPKPSERPLCEDWNLRGLLWTDALFPSDWFSNNKVDEDEKSFELPSMTEYRRERVLWLGWNLAAHKKWIIYDEQTKQFRATSEFHKDAHDLAAEDATLREQDDAMSIVSTTDSTATMVDDSTKSRNSGGGDESDAGDSSAVEKGEYK
ncbi:hypothetical protein N0V93_009230 [Gnomoniopsis smithogilvyi]|uniref:DNA/RNA-binding domain-containing protein n=1 Tax=Gnomoniopsis smithogilvyi TaxID=1191159 RepID=A0A9W9CSM2_9PEZI|nr:hypothetical protein N0V93_009230 [Gnomoniopsis smithogilvyi]